MFNDMSNDFEQYRIEFDILCQERLTRGAEDYGQFGFMNNNVFEMIYEELSDLCNYALFMYIKTRLIERNLEDEIRRHRSDPDVGTD